MSYETVHIDLSQKNRSFVCGAKAGNDRQPVETNMAGTLEVASKLFDADKKVINPKLFSNEGR